MLEFTSRAIVDRTAAAAERSTLFDEMTADRPGVQAQLQALRAQRQIILDGA